MPAADVGGRGGRRGAFWMGCSARNGATSMADAITSTCSASARPLSTIHVACASLTATMRSNSENEIRSIVENRPMRATLCRAKAAV